MKVNLTKLAKVMRRFALGAAVIAAISSGLSCNWEAVIAWICACIWLVDVMFIEKVCERFAKENINIIKSLDYALFLLRKKMNESYFDNLWSEREWE